MKKYQILIAFQYSFKSSFSQDKILPNLEVSSIEVKQDSRVSNKSELIGIYQHLEHLEKIFIQIEDRKSEEEGLIQVEKNSSRIIKDSTQSNDLCQKVQGGSQLVKDISMKIQDLFAYNSKLKKEIQDIMAQNSKLKCQQIQAKKLIQDLQRQLQLQTTQLQCTVLRQQQLLAGNKKLSQAMKTTRDQYLVLKSKNDKENLELLNSRQATKRLNQLIINLAQHMGMRNIPLDNKNQQHSIARMLSNLKHRFNQIKYFGGSKIIKQSYGNFIVDEITKFTQKSIEKCTLLYQLDRKNTNFLQYIIGKPDLLVLVKLKNGFVVGGYSSTPFYKRKQKQIPKKQEIGKGLLFSVTNKLAFKMKKDPKLPVISDVNYDSSYFNFGNHEIRFKAKEYRLFCNFGNPRSVFESSKVSRRKFLGQSVDEIELLQFEFYQLMFK